jgi:hypothetical protein
LIIDPDLLDDYPPERSINYSFPAQLTIIFAKVAIQTALSIVFNANFISEYSSISYAELPTAREDRVGPGPSRPRATRR